MEMVILGDKKIRYLN
uniref:Uncharacterized protein n=1 Tax=Arundo donax TaxID=35708 RepID=A0A0A9HCV0_ARUDO